jgi:hypothetical protein
MNSRVLGVCLLLASLAVGSFTMAFVKVAEKASAAQTARIQHLGCPPRLLTLGDRTSKHQGIHDAIGGKSVDGVGFWQVRSSS